MTHTPLPVTMPEAPPEMIETFGTVPILDAEGKLLCTVGRDKKAAYPIAERAALIVEAVNSHATLKAKAALCDEMAQALADLLSNEGRGAGEILTSCKEKARAALLKHKEASNA